MLTSQEGPGRTSTARKSGSIGIPGVKIVKRLCAGGKQQRGAREAEGVTTALPYLRAFGKGVLIFQGAVSLLRAKWLTTIYTDSQSLRG